MEPLELIPAIHIRRRRAVLLTRRSGTSIDMGDPVEWAEKWCVGGAAQIQVFDLDASLGEYCNLPVIRDIVQATDCKISLTGGIHDDASLDISLNTGVSSVVLWTSALRQPEWCQGVIASHPGLISMGVDAYGTQTEKGWQPSNNVFEIVEEMGAAGARCFVVRCMDSHGSLTGPNYELLGAMCARTTTPVVAVGGIGSVEDLRRLRGLVPIGIRGAIVGTALVEGHFSLPEALAITRGERPPRDRLSSFPLPVGHYPRGTASKRNPHHRW